MGLIWLTEGYGGLQDPEQGKGVDVESERDSSFDFGEYDRISKGGDPREFIKQTMLHHESTFRYQVLELHRLYWTQKNLMNDFSSNGLGKYAVWAGKQMPTLEMATEENISLMPHTPMKNSIEGKRLPTSEHYNTNCSKFQLDQHRGFSPQFPADEYNKSAVDGHLQVSHFYRSKPVVDLEAVELTLANGGGENNEIISDRKKLSSKQSYVHTQNVIDLEEPTMLGSKEEGTSISSFSLRTPMLCSEVMYDSQLPALSDMTSCERTSKDSGHTNSANRLHAGQSETCGTQSNTLFANTEPSTKFEFDLNVVQLEESSTSLIDPEVMFTSNSAVSSATSVGVTDESHASTHPSTCLLRECPKETSIVLKLEMLSSQHKGTSFLLDGCDVSEPCKTRDSGENSKVGGSSWHHDADNANPMVIGSDSNVSVEIHRVSDEVVSHGFHVGNHQSSNGSLSTSPPTSYNLSYKITNSSLEHPISDSRMVTEDVNFHSSLGSTNLPYEVAGCSGYKRAEGESEEDTLSSRAYMQHRVQAEMYGSLEKQHDEPCQSFSVRDKSFSTGSQDVLENPVIFVGQDPENRCLDSMVTDACPILQDPAAKFNSGACLQNKLCIHDELGAQEHLEPEPNQAAEIDHSILMAAESLVHIFQDSASSSFAPMELEVEKRTEQPQYSSDSFESIVLALQESRDDECSTPFRPAEKDKEKDDACRFKSRSGRRLRDFQKDILPGLVSLSRHEICEDLHAFAEIVRSDELRKRGAGKSFRVTRRSRLYPIGRKR